MKRLELFPFFVGFDRSARSRSPKAPVLPVLALSAAVGLVVPAQAQSSDAPLVASADQTAGAAAAPAQTVPPAQKKESANFHVIKVGLTGLSIDDSDESSKIRRFVIPRDGVVRFENVGANEATLTLSGEQSPIKLKKGEAKEFTGTKSNDMTVTVSTGSGGFTTDVEIIVAKKLEFFGKIGAGISLTSGDDFGKYDLKTDTGGTQRIVRGDSRRVTGTLTGQIFVAFDDEMGMNSKSGWLPKLLTLGAYSPSHHRFGLVASIAASEATDPTYQIGPAWFLDREGKLVVSFGVQFRQRDALLFGLKDGDAFSGSALPTRKEWVKNFFIGLTFNLQSK
ncbi:MAG: hypothetical protein JST30_04495 [Armatimonadetes bacterium]|nr:hypothetical protein [Armatimonadota bacterium]